MTTTLAITAYDRIRELLASGEFPPGCHLVNQELSRRVGVGLTPVREAVTRLASEGLLQHTPGAGVFVRRPSTADVLQLCDLRAVLEPFAAQQAAEHRSEGDLHEMRAALAEEFNVIREVAKLGGQDVPRDLVQQWLRIERRFHSMILSAARNPWLAKAVADVSLLSIVFSQDLFEPAILTVNHLVISWRDHRRVLRLIKGRASDAAADLMRQHLAAGRLQVEAFLSRRLAARHSIHAEPAPEWPPGFQPLTKRRGRPPSKGKAKPAVLKRKRRSGAQS
jgi:DNA-binding GntR family transcriptional regulator